MYSDPERIRRARRYLLPWGTGGPARVDHDGRGTVVVVLADAAHLSDALACDMVGPTTAVFVPGDTADTTDRGTMYAYGGALDEPGADLSLDDEFFLQTQDYAAGEFAVVIGPTLARVTCPEDFAAFLAHADRAKDEGVFPDHLLHPVAQLGDLPALGGRHDAGGPRTRVYVDASGRISVSPWGLPLGKLGDALDDLDAAWRQHNAQSSHPCAVAIGGALDEDTRATSLLARPWIGRYLDAVAALRELRVRGVETAAVSGFGTRVVPALAELDQDDPADAPLLLWNEDDAFAHVASEGRTLRFEPAGAAAVEALVVCGSVEAAGEHVDPRHVETVATTFERAGVPFGTRPTT